MQDPTEQGVCDAHGVCAAIAKALKRARKARAIAGAAVGSLEVLYHLDHAIASLGIAQCIATDDVLEALEEWEDGEVIRGPHGEYLMDGFALVACS